MRLLNVSTLRLEEFFEYPPEYAILSHTWTQGQEVLYKDCDDLEAVFKQIPPGFESDLSYAPPSPSTETSFIPKKGHVKVKRCCELADLQGYDYVWIDTCCIDKSSSAELSEAINSMFTYYERSAVCYVFLDDVDRPQGSYYAQTGDMSFDLYPSSHGNFEQLKDSKWVSRGWTLQELIAPAKVEFYDRAGKFCGTRQDLAADLHQATGIDTEVLERECHQALDLAQFSIAQRMSWAARRRTTRPEDLAYCMLGLFDVNIPLLYGEGSKKAFYRLQEEIMKYSMDQSILAWEPRAIGRRPYFLGILAHSPADFTDSADVVCFRGEGEPFEMTNKGLRVTLPVIPRLGSPYLEVALNCRRKDDLDCPISLYLSKATDTGTTANNLYNRIRGLYSANWEEVHKSPRKMLYLDRNAFRPSRAALEGYCFWFKFNKSSCQAMDNSQMRYWRLHQPSKGELIERSRKLRLDTDAVHTVTTSKISTYFVEYSERSEPTEFPRLRFAIKRGEIFHCTTTVIFPSYICGFEDLFGDDLLPTYYCTRGDFKHKIQTSIVGPPKSVMGEYVYEINVDFDIVFAPAEKPASDTHAVPLGAQG